MAYKYLNRYILETLVVWCKKKKIEHFGTRALTWMNDCSYEKHTIQKKNLLCAFKANIINASN